MDPTPTTAVTDANRRSQFRYAENDTGRMAGDIVVALGSLANR